MGNMERVKKIKEKFRASDTNGDGTLQYDEFLAVLQRGKPEFSKKDASILFKKVDTNGSGEIDFCEFVDFVFNDKLATEILPDLADVDAEEQEAKAQVLNTEVSLRSGASRAVKRSGGDWKRMSWKERLGEIRKQGSTVTLATAEEKSASTEAAGEDVQSAPDSQPGQVRQPRPVQTTSSACETAEEQPVKAKRPPKMPKEQHKQSSDLLSEARRREIGNGAVTDTLPPHGSVQQLRRKSEPVARPPSNSHSKHASGRAKSLCSPAEISKVAGGEPQLVKHRRTEKHAHTVSGASMASGIAAMDQSRLVDYSLGRDDLEFAGRARETLKELDNFKNTLRVAGSPMHIVDIERFVAKGTAGWVFAARKKEGGEKIAMKMVRMTQVRTAIREWYISELLRRAGGASGIVQTDDVVSVVARYEAPEIIEEQLKDAGPVPYYCCLFQEFMNGGDLEREGLSLEVKFRCLADAAATLAYMHAQGISHRDIKPENILLQEEDGQVSVAKLGDLGCAEVSEQSQGEDIRRFGVTIFSLATGEPWKQNRLVREEHDNLLSRLAEFVEGASCPALGKLPSIVEPMLSKKVSMVEVSKAMEALKSDFVGF